MAERVYSVESLAATKYAEPTGNSVVGTTATVTIGAADVATNADDTLYATFVTTEQLEAFTTVQGLVSDVALIKALLTAQNFTAAAGTTATVINKDGKPLVLVGLGARADLQIVKTAAKSVTDIARQQKRANVVVYVEPTTTVYEKEQVAIGFGKGVKNSKKSFAPEVVVDIKDVVDVIIRGLFYTNWEHDKYIDTIFTVKNFTLVGVDVDVKTVHDSVMGAESVTFAREIGSLRFRDANNTYMMNTAKAVAAANADVLSIKVMDKQQLLAEGYNLINAVNQGSTDPCYIVAIEYTPPGFDKASGVKPHAYVGKTLTFDTGGYNIKTAGMLTMHCDKHGGCNTLSLMRNLALTRPALPRQIVGVLTITDNEVSADAVHPNTIINTKCVARPKGTISVAVINTDAEGRLALADAVTFVQEYYKPERITTQATLTGAILLSFGHYATGLFTNCQYIAEEIKQVGEQTGELFWQLPILPQNHTDIKGKECDLLNLAGSRYMGSSTAASFIETFVGDDVEFVHLDIAGTSSCPGNEATGQPVTALQKYIVKQ
eukprot:UN00184